MATWKKVLTEAQIDTDGTFGSPVDTLVPSQAAVKTYVDAQVDTADSITELADVTITSSAANELLFSTGANAWANKTLAEAGIQPLDAQLTTLAGYSAAQVTRGIADGNTLECAAGIADNDFLRIDGTEVEGRSATEVLGDIGAQAALTFGTANGHSLKVVTSPGADVDANDFAVFTSDHDTAGGGLKGLGAQEVRSAIGAAATAGQSSQNFAANNLTVAGNLTVSGTHITTATETLAIADNTLILNSDLTTATDVDAGIVVERGSGVDNATFYWDEGDDRWRVGTNDDADLSTSPTYSADVMQVRIDGAAINTSSTEVPIGHMQYHANELYLRVED